MQHENIVPSRDKNRRVTPKFREVIKFCTQTAPQNLLLLFLLEVYDYLGKAGKKREIYRIDKTWRGEEGIERKGWEGSEGRERWSV